MQSLPRDGPGPPDQPRELLGHVGRVQRAAVGLSEEQVVLNPVVSEPGLCCVLTRQVGAQHQQIFGSRTTTPSEDGVLDLLCTVSHPYCTIWCDAGRAPRLDAGRSGQSGGTADTAGGSPRSPGTHPSDLRSTPSPDTAPLRRGGPQLRLDRRRQLDQLGHVVGQQARIHAAENYRLAHTYLTRAEKAFGDDRGWQAENLNNLAGLALDMAQASGVRLQVGRAFEALGRAALKADDKERGIENFRQALALYDVECFVDCVRRSRHRGHTSLDFARAHASGMRTSATGRPMTPGRPDSASQRASAHRDRQASSWPPAFRASTALAVLPSSPPRTRLPSSPSRPPSSLPLRFLPSRTTTASICVVPSASRVKV